MCLRIHCSSECLLSTQSSVRHFSFSFFYPHCFTLSPLITISHNIIVQDVHSNGHTSHRIQANWSVTKNITKLIMTEASLDLTKKRTKYTHQFQSLDSEWIFVLRVWQRTMFFVAVFKTILFFAVLKCSRDHFFLQSNRPFFNFSNYEKETMGKYRRALL